MHCFNETNNRVFCFFVSDLQDRMMMELHSKGKTIEDIEEVLHRIPLHPRVIPAIQAAHAFGYVTMLLFSLHKILFLFFFYFILTI